MPRFRRFLRPTRSPVDAAVDQVMNALDTADSRAGSDATVQACTAVRDEAIVVEHERQPRGQYGLCARDRDGVHVIYVDPSLSGDLRFHTVLHELGHIVLGHNDARQARSSDRLTALLTGSGASDSSSCVVPQFREYAQNEIEAEQFASTMARRLRRGLTSRRLSRLDEAFG